VRKTINPLIYQCCNLPVSSTSDEILDLSIKKRKSNNVHNFEKRSATTHPIDCPRPLNFTDTSPAKISAQSCDGKSVNGALSAVSCSRRTVEAELVRLPLTKGWRRQTCVRSLSSSGIRGDVLYYSPCGRKFASVAEISRYLKKKNEDTKLLVDYFTFSSKIVVGEFFYVAQDGIKNISEEDVLAMVQNIRRTNGIQKSGGKRQIFNTTRSSLDSKSMSNYGHKNSGNFFATVDGIGYNNCHEHVSAEDEELIGESVICCITDLIDRIEESQRMI